MSTQPSKENIQLINAEIDATSETIAAIATPPGVGGVGIVRISGPDAFAIGQRLFRRPGKADAGTFELVSHLLTYGYVIDPATHERIDEVLAAFMNAPRTYTCEDVVEFQAHGGPLILRRILELTLAAGARAARPGEMTLRAFVHGRLDLAQAEAVMSLVSAESEAGRRLALRQLQGELSEQIQQARAAALGALARIEASIDFPEEEVPLPDPTELAALTGEAEQCIRQLLASADRGRILREGLRIAIVGRPNVGKSSLLNALLRSERAIVTAIAGTTRDTIEERTTINGIPVHIVDTAGLTPTDDPIERIGVARSREAAQTADLLLFVLDASEPLTDLDLAAATELQALAENTDEETGAALLLPPVILVLNKSDLPQLVQEHEVQKLWSAAQLVLSSALSSTGVTAVEQTITALVLGGDAQASDMLVTNARHADALRRATEHLAAAQETLQKAVPLDFVSIDLRTALEALGEITGETATGDLLDRIFSDFCIGK